MLLNKIFITIDYSYAEFCVRKTYSEAPLTWAQLVLQNQKPYFISFSKYARIRVPIYNKQSKQSIFKGTLSDPTNNKAQVPPHILPRKP